VIEALWPADGAPSPAPVLRDYSFGYGADLLRMSRSWLVHAIRVITVQSA
jgi:hypothetical protein